MLVENIAAPAAAVEEFFRNVRREGFFSMFGSLKGQGKWRNRWSGIGDDNRPYDTPMGSRMQFRDFSFSHFERGSDA